MKSLRAVSLSSIASSFRCGAGDQLPPANSSISMPSSAAVRMSAAKSSPPRLSVIMPIFMSSSLPWQWRPALTLTPSARGKDQIRQEQRERRPDRDEAEHDEERDQPGQDRARHRLVADAGDARGDEQHDADRRMDGAEDQIEDHDQAELHGIDAEA